MKIIKIITTILALSVASVFALDGGNGEKSITIGTSTIQLVFNQADMVSIVPHSAVTVYAAINQSVAEFNRVMTTTNAVPIDTDTGAYTFKSNQKINYVCLKTLSGTADITISGSGFYTGPGAGAGAPVIVTNTVDVSIVSTAAVNIVTMPAPGGPTALAGIPQDFTASWVDLGAEIDCSGFNSLVLWVDVDANDSVDMQIRALGKHTTAGADEYVFPIKNPSSGTVTEISPQYFEFIEDSDNEYLIPVEVDNLIGYVQFQIKAGTVGATAGQIDDAKFTTGYR